ncbi:hypothetical protein [Arthrobacter caoxuetaonis]|uniref:hypothetical protein n=1 Tax=Arthrobacter caoxuetaonis TaxID=2886935 RepID=UPI0022B11B8E|nr:hypothetical protein [Arthrobacter caoxuetaonis]
MNKEHGWPAPEERTGEVAGRESPEDGRRPEAGDGADSGVSTESGDAGQLSSLEPQPAENQASAAAEAESAPAPSGPSYAAGPGFAPPGYAPPSGYAAPAGYSAPAGNGGPGSYGQAQSGNGGYGGYGQAPAGYAPPSGYAAPAGYSAPAGHGAPYGYGGYAGPGGYAGQGPGPGGPAGYGNGPGYGSHQRKSPGKGLAIAAVCVAGVGLLFSWIWFLNFITYLAGAVALGLGIPALIKGIKAKNVALPLSVIALSFAVVAMVAATIINLTVQYDSPDTEMNPGYSQGQAVPGPVPAETPEPVPADEQATEQATERQEQPGLPDRDYSADISGSFYTDIIEQPAASAGEGVQVGDYTVTLAEVDRDASAEVLERDPSAGEPTHGYVLFEFRAVYNGSASGGTGRPDLDFTPKFIGADARLHSVLNCSMDLGVSSSDRPSLAPGETGTYEICFDLPEAALAEDSRVGLRMILAERNEDVYWRLP